MIIGNLLLFVFIACGCISLIIYFRTIVSDIKKESPFYINPYLLYGVVFVVLFFGGVWFVCKTLAYFFKDLFVELKSKFTK